MLSERIARKIDRTQTCWLWLATTTEDGYGRIRHEGRLRPAHRVVYEQLVGAIPEGMQLDHLCRVRNCVNPEHLEPVSPRVNTLRGSTLAASQLLRTHCPRGHAYDDQNTARNDGHRRCKACRAAKNAQPVTCAACGHVGRYDNSTRHRRSCATAMEGGQ